MSEVIYKINPIEDYLVANEYEKQKERVKYEKPRYLKGKNEVVVCWYCGYVIINGEMIRFWKIGLQKVFELIPL